MFTKSNLEFLKFMLTMFWFFTAFFHANWYNFVDQLNTEGLFLLELISKKRCCCVRILRTTNSLGHTEAGPRFSPI